MRLFGLTLAFCALLVFGAADAQVGLPFPGPGMPAASGGGYTGPGDVTTWKTFWSLRAYSAAKRGTKAVNACNSTGGGDVCVDLLTDAVTGNLVSQSVNGGTCPGTNCTVKIVYDQSGQNYCTGSVPCDLVQATVANRPTLTANCVNTSLPCMTFVPANSQILVSNGLFPPNAGQPATVTWVANRNATGTTTSPGLQGAGGIWLSYFSSNQVFINAGVTVGPVTASDAAWHSIQAVFTTAPNSVISVDNVETTGDAGTGGIVSGDFFNMGARTGTTNPMDGKIVEMGADATLHAGAARTSMCHNQFAYWGTATSC